jgi:hypothetical protein
MDMLSSFLLRRRRTARASAQPVRRLPRVWRELADLPSDLSREFTRRTIPAGPRRAEALAHR